MKIDLTKIIKVDKEKFVLLPIFPNIIEDKIIFGIKINSIDNETNQKELSYLINLNSKTNEIIWKIELDSYLRTRIKYNGTDLFICTNYELLSVDLISGKENWKKKFKIHTDPEISLVKNRLFFSNWGEIQEINPVNGKKISSKKPRVKWFDSEITESNNRFFVSTSNSKILELSSSLEVLNEYKYPGGWAIACKPLIHNKKIISSSYGGKIISFDLKDNQSFKKINKKAGSKPKQIKIGQYGFFYEGNSEYKLTCYDLDNYKKKWSNNINLVQILAEINNELVSIFKENDNYVVGVINIENGEIKEILDKSIYKNWDVYQWDLWEGVDIVSNNNLLVFAYEPNLLTIIDCI